MSVIPSALESGPAPANLQTSILNGNLRIASSGGQGQQNAVYSITGGPIISNVNLNLPALAADDTIATLSANNNWTGIHTFAQGLNASGTINTTGPINSTSSITSGSVIAQTITATGNLVAGNINTSGNFNAANLVTPGTLSVGTTATITGTINALTTTTTGALNSGNHTVTGNATVTGSHTVNGLHFVSSTGGITNQGNLTAHTPTNKPYVPGVGHLLLRNDTGATDGDWYGITTGGTHGIIIGTGTTNIIGVFGTHGQTQQAGGNVIAGATYTNNESVMLNRVYSCLRNIGWISQ